MAKVGGEEAGDTYDDLDLLERLESLREEMAELGVTTLAEIDRRIRELHVKLDAQEEGQAPTA